MSDLVEVGAQAMCNAAWAGVGEDWSLASDEQREEFRLMFRAALSVLEPRIEALRKALIDAGRNAGALLADDVSDEFLAYVPGEVKGRIEALERAPAVARFVERERCARIAEGEAHEHGRAAHAIAAAIRNGERGQGWQPIETLREASLPDGELVLVAGFWTSGEPWRAIGAAWADGMVSGDWVDIDGPTHWRPLPPAPTGERE